MRNRAPAGYASISKNEVRGLRFTQLLGRDMTKTLNRITHEKLEDGIVVSGSIGSGETWPEAYRRSLDSWQYGPIVAELLLHDVELIFDGCEEAGDIATHNEWLRAVWCMIEQLEMTLKPLSELERLKKYEADIRSGVIFKDEDSSS
jgi:hypothetical protein